MRSDLLARSFRHRALQLPCCAEFFFTRGRPRRAVEPVEKWDGDVEVPTLHETRFVMASMMLTQFGDEAEARDRMLQRQVISEVQPLVGQEKHHGGDGDEHRDVGRNEPLDDEREGQDEREKNEHDSVSGHQDKPPLAPAFYGHIAICEDDVMVKFVPFVEQTKQRLTSMQNALVRSPFESKRCEERDRDREQLDGSQRIRLNSNDCDDEYTQTDHRGDRGSVR